MGTPTVILDSGLQQISGAAATVQSGKSGTGAYASKEVRAQSGKGPLRLITGFITMATGYATGGDDISFIWKQFSPTARNSSRVATAWDLRGIIVMPVANNASPATALKLVTIDTATKKAQVFTALGTEAANASDQSAVTVAFLAWGS